MNTINTIESINARRAGEIARMERAESVKEATIVKIEALTAQIEKLNQRVSDAENVARMADAAVNECDAQIMAIEKQAKKEARAVKKEMKQERSAMEFLANPESLHAGDFTNQLIELCKMNDRLMLSNSGANLWITRDKRGMTYEERTAGYGESVKELIHEMGGKWSPKKGAFYIPTARKESVN